ncbi:SLOG family protein [Micromonosporaceae bacterium Da 78-11]
MPEPTFRLLLTGSRHCSAAEERFVWHILDRTCAPHLAASTRIVVIEGECPYGGVDLAGRRWAEQTPGADFEPHPADWGRHGSSAGPRRNQQMVDAGAHLCLAFPDVQSRGTWDCAKKAANAGILVRVYPLALAVPASSRAA